MADENSRYTLSVVLTVSEDGNPVPKRQDVILNQYDLKYEAMQTLQTTIAGAVLQALGGMGAAKAEEVKAKRGQADSKVPAPNAFVR